MIPGAEVFDAQTGELIIRFAGPSGTFHADSERLYSSGPEGLCVWDPATGERTGHIPGFAPSHHHRGSHELVAIEGGGLSRWKSPEPTHPQ